ncbi:MAG: DUF4279 domain-containing protein [Curtobacterium sp.]
MTGWDAFELRVESDELTPEVITGLLDLAPTETHVKGMLFHEDLPNGRRFATNIWILHKRSMQFEAFPEIVNVLESRIPQITGLPSSASVSLEWNGILPADKESVVLTQRSLNVLSRLGLAVTISMLT